MRQLAQGIEHKIVAYDRSKALGGCLIYLSGRDHTILVPDELIEWRQHDAIQTLRQKIEQGVFGSRMLVLKDNGGVLIFDKLSDGVA